MSLVEEQLAIDLGCSIGDIRSTANVFITGQAGWRARNYAKKPVTIICINNKVIVRSENEALTNALRAVWQDLAGEWLGEVRYMNQLIKILTEYGYEINEYYPNFIPRTDLDNTVAVVDEHLQWYDPIEIKQFRGDSRFSQSFAFSQADPDKIGVAYIEDGEILAMAGANPNGKYLWEIGIEIVQANKHQGLATKLVDALKQRIIADTDGQIVPYYTTAFTHTKSINVAIRAGFQIGWTEIAIIEK
ncbi:GNAT family N-acetyltransferase [Periweissella cryptocerci]|nr:GNAT family N-acetyltransferase [Periweissella cryptocerci]